jgi:sugar phosphate isomerase/epimerase
VSKASSSTQLRMGLCWGTAPEAHDVETLARLAAAHGFASISVTAGHYQKSRSAGATDRQLQRLLADSGVRVNAIDPLIGILPGVPRAADVAPDYQKYFEFTEEQCLAAAAGLNAESINLAHFLGSAVPVTQLVDAAGAFARRAQNAGRKVTVEFIPDTGIPNLATAMQMVAGAASSNFGVMFDTWHFARSEGKLEQLRALPKGAIGGLQISDRVEPPAGAAYVPMSGRSLPGEGELPLIEILNIIVPNNPGVDIGVEVFSGELRALPSDTALERVAAATRKILDRLAV